MRTRVLDPTGSEKSERHGPSGNTRNSIAVLVSELLLKSEAIPDTFISESQHARHSKEALRSAFSYDGSVMDFSQAPSISLSFPFSEYLFGDPKSVHTMADNE
jgi:hypothetical protein